MLATRHLHLPALHNTQFDYNRIEPTVLSNDLFSVTSCIRVTLHLLSNVAHALSIEM